MWNDIVIGNGHKGCSAIRVFAIGGEHSISENSVSYWISDLYLGAQITIFKDTEEGRQLSQFINEKAHIDTIRPWLDGLVLQHIDREVLKNLIDRAIEQAFQKGSSHRAEVIREALGLN